jgi:ureidoacrylate peracid hydrolase
MPVAPRIALEDVLAPQRAALLVIDVQNDFINPAGWSARHAPDGPSLRHVIPVINALIGAARRAGATVAYVTMEHGPEIDAPNYQARYVARGMEDDILCRAGTWGAALDAALTQPSAEDIVVVRHSYDGFARTDLEERLRARGIETCVATGVVTNLCVQNTIQHAFSLGFYTALVSDGAAAATDAEHDMALDAFRRFFGPVLAGEEIVRLWTEAAAGSAAA